MLPSGLAASARGVSPNSVITVRGAPPSVAPGSLASNTQTSARPIPDVVRSASGTAVFCPRCAVVMNARLWPGPAKTRSRGSSPTSSVRTTLGGLADTSTTLTLSDRWFTTHTSSSLRAATATGSRPTGTESVWVSPAPPTSKTSSRLSGVFTAKSRVPDGDRASGRTCPLSKTTNGPAAHGDVTRTPISRISLGDNRETAVMGSSPLKDDG